MAYVWLQHEASKAPQHRRIQEGDEEPDPSEDTAEADSEAERLESDLEEEIGPGMLQSSPPKRHFVATQSHLHASWQIHTLAWTGKAN